MAKILVIGNGGREHAIASAFAQSEQVSKVFVFPGNVGMSQVHPYHNKEKVTLVSDISSSNIKDIYEIVLDKHIDLVFVGPELYLEQGISDYLEDKGVAVIGPNKKAAQLETSKIFAKEFMIRHKIPTAAYVSFSDLESAKEYLHTVSFPIVIKADGLAAGKGVVIANSLSESETALSQMMKQKLFGEAGKNIVIEEFLQGWEASVFAITDGKNYQLTIASQDHKRLNDNNTGPNTGGMGAYAPVDKANPYMETIDRTIFKPLFESLKEENIEYKGILYAGLIFTQDGPKVLEFNCRLGDPETQVLLPLLDTDIYDICSAIVDKTVHKLNIQWLPKYAVNIVAAAKGYPFSYEKGKIITVSDKFFEDADVRIFYSGVAPNKAKTPTALVTNGGRVLSVTAIADKLDDAINKAYSHLQFVYFEDMYFRQDIASETNK